MFLKRKQCFWSLLQTLVHKKEYAGLMMAEFDSFETNKKIIDRLIEEGVFTDWFYFF
jgi:hypothetical protein